MVGVKGRRAKKDEGTEGWRGGKERKKERGMICDKS